MVKSWSCARNGSSIGLRALPAIAGLLALLGLSDGSAVAATLVEGSSAASVAQGLRTGEARIPYETFKASLRSWGMTARADGLAQSETDAIRRHLLSMYDGVSVAGSFARDGQTFDCFAAAEQPSIRLLGGVVAVPPPFSPFGRGQASAPEEKTAGREGCASGTVPIRRITPEEIARFGSLSAFLAKDPSLARSASTVGPSVSGDWTGVETQPGGPLGGHFNLTLELSGPTASGAIYGVSAVTVAGEPQYYALSYLSGSIQNGLVVLKESSPFLENAPPGASWCLTTLTLAYETSGTPFLQGYLTGAGCNSAATKLVFAKSSHKYATRGQTVTNYGGWSALSLWKPRLDAGAGQIFSLSQHWYSAGSSSSLQTAEVGWQEYPVKYGTFNPALFIYWTSDDYKKTGCYNTDCAGFVQTDSAIPVGGTYSQYGQNGNQVSEISVGFYLHNGAWWLGYGNTWIGYYPVKLYGSGPMSTSAQAIEFGGETVGLTSWPAMGSGQFASGSGAAFDTDIAYRDSSDVLHAANLTYQGEPSPSCYTAGPASFTFITGSYFYFGGPGGTGC
jgi:hypothetical protein